MKKGLEAVVGNPKHLFVVDTNVEMLNCFAPFVLANAWDYLRDDEFGRQLIEAAEKQRKLKHHPNVVVIYDLVTRELDNIMHNEKQKHLHGLAGRARSVLSDIRDLGQIAESESASYVPLSNGSRIYFIEHDEKEFLEEPRFDPNIDDRLVWNFGRLLGKNLTSGYTVQLVSQDKILRDKARDHISGLLFNHAKQVELVKKCTGEFEFENAAEDPHQRYRGNVKIELSPAEFQPYLTGSPVSLSDGTEQPKPFRIQRVKPNQLIEIHCDTKVMHRIVKPEGSGMTARALENYEDFMKAADKHNPERYAMTPTDIELPKEELTTKFVEELFKGDSSLTDDYKTNLWKKMRAHKGDPERAYREIMFSLSNHRAKQGKNHTFRLPFNKSLRPKKEQMYALELLNDPTITVVSLVGPPGTGKTLWTLYSGLVQLTQEKSYKEIVYFRPPIGLNEGHGFVKGGLREKLDMWLRPCKDSLMEIFNGYGGNLQQRRNAEEEVKRIEAQGLIRLDEADTHQQGATWRDRYVVIDEAQLLTRDQMRTMVNRVGEGTKLVLIGDPHQVGATAQVTHWFLNKRNNGLTHVVERLQGQELYGHMTFTEDGTIMRSRTARELGRLL